MAAVDTESAPLVSVVVVVHTMPREIPRTLRSLSPDYQRGIDADDYEVIVVDNGSDEPLDEDMLASFPGTLRSYRLAPAPPSPARAVNLGLERSRGRVIGLSIDGARIVSPGFVAYGLRGTTLAPRSVVATLAWHLGPVQHMHAAEAGYDQVAEDALLAESGWERDGYRLFSVSTLAASSHRGWFGPLAESNGLFMKRELWDELEGMDERFVIPGGGRANHDLYRRACELDGAQLVVVLGEGTFHQIHGGAATSRRQRRPEADAEYETLRGKPFRPPQNQPLYIGHLPDTALDHLEASVRWLAEDIRGR